MTQNQETVLREVLADSGQNVQCELLTGCGHSVQCEVLTDSGQNIEDSSGHSDTKPADGTL